MESLVMCAPILTTARLQLRTWCDSDLAPFSVINADPRVMEFFPRVLTESESDGFAIGARKLLAERGFGWWALEVRETRQFIGFVGLSVPAFKTHFTPCVEIGWRLAFDHWGKGYASEAAKAALTHAFGALALPEVVAFTAVLNLRSRRLMERLEMSRSEGDDFDHPALPEGHPIRRHVLYRLARSDPAAARFARSSYDRPAIRQGPRMKRKPSR